MRKVFRGICFILLLVASICFVFKVVAWKDTTGDYYSNSQQLYNTEEDTIDVVFVGSSHVFCGIDPSLIWEEGGISSFNLSVSGMDKESAYYYLVELLKTQSPEVVMVDLYPLIFDKHAVIANEYRNMLSMKPSSNSYNLVKAYADEEDQMNYLLRMPIYHTRYRELKKYDFVENPINLFGRGQLMQFNGGSSFQSDTAIDESQILSEQNAEWMNRFVQLADEYGFYLEFIVVPFYTEETSQIIAAKNYASANGITLLDFNEISFGLDYDNDFSDLQHLSYTGAQKLSNYLCDYIGNRYLLNNHKDDSRYEAWNQDLNYQNHLLFEDQLNKRKVNADDYFSYLVTGSGLVTVVSLNGEYGQWMQDIVPWLEQLGIPEEEYDMGGIWLITDDGISHVMEGSSQETVYYDLSPYKTLKMSVMQAGDRTFDNILINRESGETIFDGLGVIVYDIVLDKTISKMAIN